MSWFTFDTAVGGADHQRWYTAQGPVVTGQPNASLTIYQNTGGNFNAPPATTAKPVGTATLSFSTCTSGQFSYSFTDGTGRTGSIALTRLTTERDLLDHHAVSDQRGLRSLRELVRWSRDGGAGLHGRSQSDYPLSLRGLVHLCAKGTAAGASGQRWYTAQGAFTARLAFDSRDDLRDHRRDIRHADPSAWPANRGRGERNAGIPELYGRDVQLHIHRWNQRRPIRDHHLEPRRPGASWLHVMKPEGRPQGERQVSITRSDCRETLRLGRVFVQSSLGLLSPASSRAFGTAGVTRSCQIRNG